jgi:hypothetical protein
MVLTARVHEPPLKAEHDSDLISSYKRGAGGSNPPAPTRFVQLDYLIETLIGDPVTTAGNHRCMLPHGEGCPAALAAVHRGAVDASRSKLKPRSLWRAPITPGVFRYWYPLTLTSTGGRCPAAICSMASSATTMPVLLPVTATVVSTSRCSARPPSPLLPFACRHSLPDARKTHGKRHTHRRPGCQPPGRSGTSAPGIGPATGDARFHQHEVPAEGETKTRCAVCSCRN